MGLGEYLTGIEQLGLSSYLPYNWYLIWKRDFALQTPSNRLKAAIIRTRDCAFDHTSNSLRKKKKTIYRGSKS